MVDHVKGKKEKKRKKKPNKTIAAFSICNPTVIFSNFCIDSFDWNGGSC